MAVTSTISGDGADLTIVIKGRFDFSSHQDFRGTYENLPHKPTRYVIDMQDTAYLDSSALGMLLLLRDYAGGDKANIQILNASDDVKRILTISNFEQLFSIE
ncbi:STAS domain-containing protein [Gilvimarinus xylanilyticus]|uniref:STAS domain-containing protein n=1 Tax=Gilvimarinus xylanilyticus TaxID=2944139 RepID=A0A9X2I0Y5_9GAMM|nr:STAS domain-containing protein [Gilvimarinus xylanilyticus]MCP8898325.1 STAS domain-containing protein [Gilvimarinus xylanilyticus]